MGPSTRLIQSVYQMKNYGKSCTHHSSSLTQFLHWSFCFRSTYKKQKRKKKFIPRLIFQPQFCLFTRSTYWMHAMLISFMQSLSRDWSKQQQQQKNKSFFFFVCVPKKKTCKRVGFFLLFHGPSNYILVFNIFQN